MRASPHHLRVGHDFKYNVRMEIGELGSSTKILAELLIYIDYFHPAFAELLRALFRFPPLPRPRPFALTDFFLKKTKSRKKR